MVVLGAMLKVVLRENGGGSEVVFGLMCDCQEALTKREDDLKETGAKSPVGDCF